MMINAVKKNKAEIELILWDFYIVCQKIKIENRQQVHEWWYFRAFCSLDWVTGPVDSIGEGGHLRARKWLLYMAACLWETGNILESALAPQGRCLIKTKTRTESLKIALTFNTEMFLGSWEQAEKDKNCNQ